MAWDFWECGRCGTLFQAEVPDNLPTHSVDVIAEMLPEGVNLCSVCKRHMASSELRQVQARSEIGRQQAAKKQRKR